MKRRGQCGRVYLRDGFHDPLAIVPPNASSGWAMLLSSSFSDEGQWFGSTQKRKNPVGLQMSGEGRWHEIRNGPVPIIKKGNRWAIGARLALIVQILFPGCKPWGQVYPGLGSLGRERDECDLSTDTGSPTTKQKASFWGAPSETGSTFLVRGGVRASCPAF
jgi:hypothetical protein